jgi:co-chaperonin GroES (HSP10)|tara:strand:+ start:574 stop:948 length:375 start_codon:yes stop_codon:yes gene_type:complete
MSESLAKKEVKAEKASQLPAPKGYKILIALPDIEEKTEGGIIKSAKSLQEEEVGSIVGMVLELGPDAYSDPRRFPSGAFCNEGDWIVMRSYSGTRFKVHGKEFRLINDDSVEAVVQDPRGIGKV